MAGMPLEYLVLGRGGKRLDLGAGSASALEKGYWKSILETSARRSYELSRCLRPYYRSDIDIPP